MRILIVKLSSLGDVVHALPVVADIRAAHPDAVVDWVVEPGFAPIVRRTAGVAEVIELPLRRWRRAGFGRPVRDEMRAFLRRLRQARYDAVLDLQGLTKSALVARLARGVSHGLANRTEGSSHEWPARWLVDRAVRIEPRIHALDRSRALAARALGYAVAGPPRHGLQTVVASSGPAAPSGPIADPGAAAAVSAAPTVLFVHGTSRADKLWPEADWIDFGRRVVAEGWLVALPHAGAEEAARAARIAAALGSAATVWPALDLGALVDRMATVQAVVGVDSGLSHIAVALGLPHLQLYNVPTAWRTGPLAAHGHRHQIALEGDPAPALDAVWQAWQRVRPEPVA